MPARQQVHRLSQPNRKERENAQSALASYVVHAVRSRPPLPVRHCGCRWHPVAQRGNASAPVARRALDCNHKFRKYSLERVLLGRRAGVESLSSLAEPSVRHQVRNSDLRRSGPIRLPRWCATPDYLSAARESVCAILEFQHIAVEHWTFRQREELDVAKAAPKIATLSEPLRRAPSSLSS